MADNIGGGMRRLWRRDLQNIVAAIRSGEFEYEEKDEKKVDWALYDEAQVNEVADILQMINRSVDIASGRIKSREPRRKRLLGRPRIPDDDIAKIMLLQCYFGLSNRVAAGFLKAVVAIRFSSSFSYKTVERGYDPDRTKSIFDEIFRLTNEWGNFGEDTVSIDGTGDPTTMKVNYETKRSEQREKREGRTDSSEAENYMPVQDKKHDFQYSVLSVGVHTKMIAGFSTVDNHMVGELSQAPTVVEDTAQNVPDFKEVLGDTLYANRKFCGLVASYGAALYSIPKSNANFRASGIPEWKWMTYKLVLDPQGFLGEYHGRSMSETVNSMMKRREPIPIRKRLPGRRGMEEYLKVNVHNLRQSCYLVYLAPTSAKTPLLAG
jgi:transposase